MYDIVPEEDIYMFKFLLIGSVMTLSLRAETIGLVELGQHPNYSVQLPPNLSNFTGITLSEILKQNPQNLFAFTAETDSGPRNLVGYFTPEPWVTVIWTTRNIGSVQKEEENFEQLFERPVVPPLVGCEVTHTCLPSNRPVVPPVNPPTSCKMTQSCLPVQPPICLHDCHPVEPPDTQVPEPVTFILMGIGLIGIATLRKNT